ncbi:MAG: hypothetical protein MUE67_01530, partial [Anaerolineales bacterium]|nr:hypothetical protein [Anaerolineales bacterium]
MKTYNRILTQLASLLTVLAILFTLSPIQPAQAGAGTTTYYHYSDVVPMQFEVGQFNAADMDYSEGEVMPHAVKITGLTVGTPYGMWINYYYKKANACGFAYITQYDANARINPILLLDGQTAASLTANGSLSAANGGLGGTMNTVGVTAGSVTVGAFTETVDQLDRYIPVSFTASATTVYFYFGFKLAEDGDCGAGTQGVADWSGGSHESRITETNQAGQTAFGIPAAQMVDADGPIKIQPADVATTIFRGQKWYDVDGNAAINTAEPFLAGWTFQLYNCGSSATCATRTQISTSSTALDGTFLVSRPTGVTAGPYYQVCEVLKTGWTQTFPITTTPYCSAPINYTGTTVSQNFGNNRVDWGDLPQPNYPTTLAVNGARHLQFPDVNADGKPESWNGQAAVW